MHFFLKGRIFSVFILAPMYPENLKNLQKFLTIPSQVNVASSLIRRLENPLKTTWLGRLSRRVFSIKGGFLYFQGQNSRC
jgi:hypothetical protein